MSLKVIIVGGVAAGASAAARIRRLDEKARIVMFERGEHISFANCGLPYYVGDVIQKRNKLLVQTPRAMNRRFNIDVRTMSEVVRIDPAARLVEVNNGLTGETYQETYDKLVLCPGASPKIPDIPGIPNRNVFVVRNVPDSDLIKDYIAAEQPRSALVIGAGFIGMEMAEMMRHLQLETTVVEASPQILAPLDPEMAAIAAKYLRKHGVNILLNTTVTALEGEGQAERAQLSDGSVITANLVVLGLGVQPETGLAAEAGLAIGDRGAILVDEYMQTTDPDIYAAGDAVQIRDFITGGSLYLPLAGPANRQGWIVANNICGRAVKYSGAQGTSIVKIMEMTAATTGKNEKFLKAAGIAYKTLHTHPASSATYYPGSTEMTVKLLFTPDEGRVLGAQIVGFDKVDKRMDVLATAIRAGMNVFDLQELELAYAPPFSSAKDPVNMIAYAAGNVVSGQLDILTWDQVPGRMKDGAFLLDVRTEAECKAGMAEGAVNISVDDLRARLEELPRDREILAYCRVGMRSYIACRILKQNGFKVTNISGGYLSYEFYK